MKTFLYLTQWFFLAPAASGAVYGVLCLLAVWRFSARPAACAGSFSAWPPATVLKPVCGLEKNQESNLASACLQDYPDFHVVYSVQNPGDPAIPVLKEIRRRYSQRATLVVKDHQAGPNGKVNNLLGGLGHAHNEILVISDSDVYLRADYLKNIVAPLADPRVGFACTLYRAGSAGRWFEKMALLTLNADFVPGVIFAYVTGASAFLYALQDSRVSGLETHDEEAAPGIFHFLQSFKIGCHAGVAGPGELQGFEFAAKLQDPGLAPGEGIIVEKDFPGLRKKLAGPPCLRGHVFTAPGTPAMPAQGLGPEAKRALGRAPAGGVKGDIRVKNERTVYRVKSRSRL